MFVNMTPHPINIFAADDVEFLASARKNVVNEGAVPLIVIPPSGEMLNAKMGSRGLGVLHGVPISEPQVLGADEPPSGDVIVSRLYAVAAQSLPPETTLWVVDSPVYKQIPDGGFAPCGCLGLAKP
jgi:hypothetical protein